MPASNVLPFTVIEVSCNSVDVAPLLTPTKYMVSVVFAVVVALEAVPLHVPLVFNDAFVTVIFPYAFYVTA